MENVIVQENKINSLHKSEFVGLVDTIPPNHVVSELCGLFNAYPNTKLVLLNLYLFLV